MFPPYPESRTIHIADKNVFDRLFAAYELKISEYTFTDLFVYREKYRTHLSHITNTTLVTVLKASLNQFCFLPPIGSKRIIDIIGEMRGATANQRLYPFYGLDETDARALEKDGFSITTLRDDWDYVYRVQDLIRLPGEKYYGKRKNIQKCITTYNPEYQPLSQEIIDDCLQLQTEWCNLKHCDAVPGLEAEFHAIKDTFLHYNALNVFGGAIRIRGQVEAFCIGEKLNSETAVIHFEKANPNIPGLYQVINQWFCSNALQHYTYVNREQDLGIPGLRRAKKSYHPAYFIKKYLAIQDT